MEILVGNRYYLGRKIGNGAFGTIYEGTIYLCSSFVKERILRLAKK